MRGATLQPLAEAPACSRMHSAWRLGLASPLPSNIGLLLSLSSLLQPSAVFSLISETLNLFCNLVDSVNPFLECF